MHALCQKMGARKVLGTHGAGAGHNGLISSGFNRASVAAIPAGHGVRPAAPGACMEEVARRYTILQRTAAPQRKGAADGRG